MRKEEACNAGLAKARSVAASIQKAFLALCLALLLIPVGALIEPGAFAEEESTEEVVIAESAPVEEPEAAPEDDAQTEDPNEADAQEPAEEDAADGIADELTEAESEEATEKDVRVDEAAAEENIAVASDIEIDDTIEMSIMGVSYNSKFLIDLSDTEKGSQLDIGLSCFPIEDNAEWEALPDTQRFDPSHFAITSSDPAVATANYSFDESVNSYRFIVTGHTPGSATFSVSYEFGRYKGSGTIGPVYVTEEANPVASIQATATTWTVRVMQYESRWHICSMEVARIPGMPDGQGSNAMHLQIKGVDPTIPPSGNMWDMFETSFSGNAVSAISIDNVLDGSDEEKKSLFSIAFCEGKFQPGTSTVTVSLKSNPSISASFDVNIIEETPHLSVSDVETTPGSVHALTYGFVEYEKVWDFLPDYLGEFLSGFPGADADIYGYAEFVSSMASSNPSVVKIDKVTDCANIGKWCPYTLTALKKGVADITATDILGQSYTFKVTVVSDGSDIVGSISFDKEQLSLKTDETDGMPLALTLVKNEDEPVEVKWTASKESVAHIENSSSGGAQIIPVSAGQCVITATAGNKAATCVVTVEPAKAAASTEASDLQGEISLPVAPDDATKAELEDIALEVSKKPLAPQETIDAAKDKFTDEGHAVLGVYEIHFVNKDDGTIHNWNKPGFPMDVRILMDDQMKTLAAKGQLTIWHLDEATGERVKMETWIDGDYLVFRTTHFSSYVLVHTPFPVDPVDGIAPELTSVGDAPVKGSPLAQTGDKAPLLPLMLMSIGLAAIGIFSFRKVRCNG